MFSRKISETDNIIVYSVDLLSFMLLFAIFFLCLGMAFFMGIFKALAILTFFVIIFVVGIWLFPLCLAVIKGYVKSVEYKGLGDWEISINKFSKGYMERAKKNPVWLSLFKIILLDRWENIYIFFGGTVKRPFSEITLMWGYYG